MFIALIAYVRAFKLLSCVGGGGGGCTEYVTVLSVVKAFIVTCPALLFNQMQFSITFPNVTLINVCAKGILINNNCSVYLILHYTLHYTDCLHIVLVVCVFPIILDLLFFLHLFFFTLSSLLCYAVLSCDSHPCDSHPCDSHPCDSHPYDTHALQFVVNVNSDVELLYLGCSLLHTICFYSLSFYKFKS